MVVGEATALALAWLQLNDEILPPFASEMKAAASPVMASLTAAFYQ